MAARRVRRNSPLVIFGNPDGAHSESRAWREVEAVVDTIAAQEVLSARGKQQLAMVSRMARDMQRQVGRGVHQNPRGDVKIGAHVQAVIYIHCRDQEPYVHGFGNADIKISSIRAGDIRVKGMHEDTDVEMFGCRDGSVRLVGTENQPLWAMHDV